MSSYGRADKRFTAHGSDGHSDVLLHFTVAFWLTILVRPPCLMPARMRPLEDLEPGEKDVLVSRREALAATAAALCGITATLKAGEARPNILWLVSEDNNPLLGCYGNRTVRTPNIDALASKGVLYRNVYSNAPVCAPSRFGILTGTYPESCSPAQHMRAIANLPAHLRTYPELLRSAGYYCTNNAKTDYNCDIDPKRIWDESDGRAHWRNRPADAPFMSVFNLITTHESQLFRSVSGRVKGEDVRIPAYLPDTPEVRDDFAGFFNLIEKMDGEIGERLQELAVSGLAEDTIVFYYSDNGGVLPRSKRFCYDEGLRCALIVYVPPKWQHLSSAKPGSIITSPVSFIDLAPTLLALVGIERPASMQGTPFLGKDVRPSKSYAFGMRNRMDECYDFCRTATDGRYRYIRNYMPNRPWGQHVAFAWNLKSYQAWERRYLAGELNPIQQRFFQTKPFEELYDLDEDPDQVRNLVSQPDHAERIDRFRAALTRHMLNINDNGFIPEGSSVEGYGNSRDPERYPLDRVLNVAEAAARGDLRTLQQQGTWLRDNNEIVRYWAAMGMAVLGEAALPMQHRLLEMMRSDPVVHVRIAAAEAVARMPSSQEQGVRALAQIVTADLAMPPRLQALNALAALGERAKAALPEIRQAAEDKQEYIFRSASYLKSVLESTYRPDMIMMRAPSGLITR